MTTIRRWTTYAILFCAMSGALQAGDTPVSCVAGAGAGVRYQPSEVAAAAESMTPETFVAALKKAEAGDLKAQATAAMVYHAGGAVPQDFAKALALANQAAARGSAEAQYLLGLMYLKAEGVSLDRKLAAEWVQDAAAQGYVPGKTLLGALYRLGWGVDLDADRAMQLTTEAAATGYGEAQFNLGSMYVQGFGSGSKDEGRCWFQRAADQGIKEALFGIADSYWDGDTAGNPAEISAGG